MGIMHWRPLSQGSEPWSSYRGVNEVQSEMNRLFDNFLGRSSHSGASERAWAPVADMYETTEELVIKLDLPGITEKDVQLSITADLLSIKGQRLGTEEAKPEAYYSLERWTGRFERMFQVPISVQADKVRASYREGVLTVRLPKVEAVKPKEIKIDVA
jgi:HSP20 family protein